MDISVPAGFVSGTGVITRADGTKVHFTMRSEGLVPLDKFSEAMGKDPMPPIQEIE